MNDCDACMGTGNNPNCMCGGTGSMAKAALYLREQLVASQLLIERLNHELATLNARRFPVHSAGFSIPWECVAPFEEQAQRNHSQSLETLARRGGLSAVELWCVMHGVRWYKSPITYEQALEWARGLIHWRKP